MKMEWSRPPPHPLKERLEGRCAKQALHKTSSLVPYMSHGPVSGLDSVQASEEVEKSSGGG